MNCIKHSEVRVVLNYRKVFELLQRAVEPNYTKAAEKKKCFVLLVGIFLGSFCYSNNHIFSLQSNLERELFFFSVRRNVKSNVSLYFTGLILISFQSL